MPESYLQKEFLEVFADGHRATVERIASRISALDIPPELLARVREIIQDEMRGLYHGNLVVFDGGSSLADHGLIKIIDDEGTTFSTHLHEICFQYYDKRP